MNEVPENQTSGSSASQPRGRPKHLKHRASKWLRHVETGVEESQRDGYSHGEEGCTAGEGASTESNTTTTTSPGIKGGRESPVENADRVVKRTATSAGV